MIIKRNLVYPFLAILICSFIPTSIVALESDQETVQWFIAEDVRLLLKCDFQQLLKNHGLLAADTSRDILFILQDRMTPELGMDLQATYQDVEGDLHKVWDHSDFIYLHAYLCWVMELTGVTIEYSLHCHAKDALLRENGRTVHSRRFLMLNYAYRNEHLVGFHFFFGAGGGGHSGTLGNGLQPGLRLESGFGLTASGFDATISMKFAKGKLEYGLVPLSIWPEDSLLIERGRGRYTAASITIGGSIRALKFGRWNLSPGLGIGWTAFQRDNFPRIREGAFHSVLNFRIDYLFGTDLEIIQKERRYDYRRVRTGIHQGMNFYLNLEVNHQEFDKETFGKGFGFLATTGIRAVVF